MLEEDKKGILLESGTNEIEVMEFTIDGSLYGINVAKVKEILVSAPVKPMPHAHAAVEGIFKPRDVVITVVDLPKYLLGVSKEKGPKDLFIVTNFNKMNIAFRVHTVVGTAVFPGGISKNLTRRYPAAERALPQELPSAGKIWSRFWTLKKLWRRSRRRPPYRCLRLISWDRGTAVTLLLWWRKIPYF